MSPARRKRFIDMVAFLSLSSKVWFVPMELEARKEGKKSRKCGVES